MAVVAAALITSCRSRSQLIVITATFPPENAVVAANVTLDSGDVPPFLATETAPSVGSRAIPTPDPTRPANIAIVDSYEVVSGDTLTGIAARFGVSLETLMAVNGILDGDMLSVGQILQLPEPPSERGSDLKLIPDSRLVRAPGSATFNVAGFVGAQPGYIRSATDTLNEISLTAAQIVERVALEYSVDARLLLALLEYKSAWLTDPLPSETAQTYPMGAPASPFGFDRNGLYRQLTWAADQLNRGYYGWKIRGLTTVEFDDGTRLLFAPSLNAGTVGVQHLLSLYNDYYTWAEQVSAQGFATVYAQYFGDPFLDAVEPLVPANIAQPELTFPFAAGETWFFTGGPHGGYGGGGAWAAVDFAPPDERPQGSEACYISDYFARAVADGVVARSGGGFVVLDLDGDGDESTGWTVVYLHLSSRDRAALGTRVTRGDPLGRPSCEGGFSNGTHLHIGRRYNGEWIPASCDACTPGQERPFFVMSGWTVIGLIEQEYQGYLRRGDERRIAEQGRLITENRVTW